MAALLEDSERAVAICRMLLQGRSGGPMADPAIVNGSGDTALHIAARLQHSMLAELLLEEGCPSCGLQTLADGSEPLHLAAANSDSAITRLLLDFGADPNNVDLDEDTPLHIATREMCAPVVRQLLSAEGSAHRDCCDPNRPNSSGDAALHIVARGGTEPEAVELAAELLGHAANATLLNANGESPLLLAARLTAKAAGELVGQLLAAGADPNAPPLAAAAAADGAGEEGSDTNPGTRSGGDDAVSGRSALHWIVANRDGDNCKLLVDAGADTEAEDLERQTALLIAVNNGDVSCVNHLLEAGADTLKCNATGDSAISLAITGDHAGLISLLLRAGADPTRRNDTGQSALDGFSRIKDAAQQKALGWALGDSCACCEQDFFFFKLKFRHHCRFCLQSVCGWCSETVHDGHRICDTCTGRGGAVEEQHAKRITAEAEARAAKRSRVHERAEEKRRALLARRHPESQRE